MGYALNGIALISTVLNFETISFDRGNDLRRQKGSGVNVLSDYQVKCHDFLLMR